MQSHDFLFESFAALFTNKTMSDTASLLGLGESDQDTQDFNFAEPQIIAIEAMGYAAGSTLPHTLRGVVRLTRGKEGYAVIRWQDWTIAPAFQEGP